MKKRLHLALGLGAATSLLATPFVISACKNTMMKDNRPVQQLCVQHNQECDQQAVANSCAEEGKQGSKSSCGGKDF